MEISGETIHECEADRIDFACVWCIQVNDDLILIIRSIHSIIAQMC